MNLHVFQDNIGHYTVQTFERLKRLEQGTSSPNVCINITDNKSVESIEGIKVFSRDWDAVLAYIKGETSIRSIYFHSYNYYAQYLLSHIRKQNKSIKFIWIFWSGEFYNLPEFLPDIYIGQSKKYIPKIRIGVRLKTLAYHLKECLLNRPYYLHFFFIRSYRHINYIAALLEQDVQNILQYANLKIRHQRFAYLPYDQFVDKNVDQVYGHTLPNSFLLMVNHSADPTLNHFDAFDRLKGIPFHGEIVLPIAYGDQTYKEDVKRYAKSLWADQVLFWETFMTPSEYTKLLRQVDFAVFNSKIQQGVGNIIVLLWYGAKLFLREENAVYIDFKKWGMHIYTVQHELTEEQLSEKLSEKQVAENQAILKEYLSSDAVDRYYVSLMDPEGIERGADL